MAHRRRHVLASILAGSVAGCLRDREERTAESIYEYPQTTVQAQTTDGTVEGQVTAAVAHTRAQQARGLSDTPRLRDGWGLLFVYNSVSLRTFYMREMDFGIDIIFADADGVITKIVSAPAPGPEEDGTDQRYHGSAQYVLEVVYGWASERGITTGDRLRFSLPPTVDGSGPSEQ